MPDRFRWLHPDAAASLAKMEADYPGCFFYSDVFRNAYGSRHRRHKNRDKRILRGKSAIYTGKKPGTSAHSFGLCTDDMVGDNIKRLRELLEDPGFVKEDYDALKRQYGWVCHRDGPEGGDHKMESEFWHYNYFGDDMDRWLSHCGRKTSGGVEAKVIYNYGPFTLDPPGVVEHLKRLGYLDADTDPSSSELRAAVRKFQDYWTLNPDGAAGPDTQRTLLYVGGTFRDTEANEHNLQGL